MSSCNKKIKELFEQILFLNTEENIGSIPYNKLEFIYSFLSNSPIAKKFNYKQEIDTRINELFPFFCLLDSKKIQYAIVKGIVNAEKAYYEYSNRKFSDLDILIPSNQIIEVENILSSLGFVQGYENRDGTIMEFSRASKVFYIHNTHQLAPFIKKCENINIKIDINFKISSSNSDTLIQEFVNDRIIFKNYKGCNIYCLTNEKDLIFNILHCYKDCTDPYQLFKRKGYHIKSFVDIYGILNRNQHNINEFNRIIKHYDLFDSVCYVIAIISCIFCDNEITSIIYNYNNFDFKKINMFGNHNEYCWTLPIKDRFNQSIVETFFDKCNMEGLKQTLEYNKNYIVV